MGRKRELKCDPLDAEVDWKPEPLDPIVEAANAKQVIEMISGQEAHWDVITRLHTVNGPPATADIFLGVIPSCSVEEATAECKRRWPRQYARGLVLQMKKATRTDGPPPVVF